MFVLTDTNFPFYLVRVRITLCCICEHDRPFLWTSDDRLKTFFKQKIWCQHIKCNGHIWAVGTLPVSGKTFTICCLLFLCFPQPVSREGARSSTLDGFPSPAATAAALICWSAHYSTKAFESTGLPQLRWQRGVLMHSLAGGLSVLSRPELHVQKG